MLRFVLRFILSGLIACAGGAYVGALAHVYQDAPTLFVFTISAPGLILLVGGLIYMQVIMLQADAWAKGQRIAHRYGTRRNP